MFGAIVCVVISALYQFADGLYAFLALRFLHGFSTGFTPVGNMSYLADICPPHRRGEAMGIIGMAASLGFPTGMFVGAYIAEHFGLEALFYVSSGTALISVLLISTFKETLPKPEPFTFRMLKINKSDLFDPGVFIPFIIMTLGIFAFGAANIVLFDQALDVGFSNENKAVFFGIYASVSLLLRYPSGLLSDRFGRRNVMIAGMVFATLATLLLAFTNDKVDFLTAAALYGIANGINSPTLFAWAVDLADKSRVGRSMGTLFIGIELGVILGSFYAGYLTATNHSNYQPVHLTSTGMTVLALIILLLSKRDKPPTAQQSQDI